MPAHHLAFTVHERTADTHPGPLDVDRLGPAGLYWLLVRFKSSLECRLKYSLVHPLATAGSRHGFRHSCSAPPPVLLSFVCECAVVLVFLRAVELWASSWRTRRRRSPRVRVSSPNRSEGPVLLDRFMFGCAQSACQENRDITRVYFATLACRSPTAPYATIPPSARRIPTPLPSAMTDVAVIQPTATIAIVLPCPTTVDESALLPATM